MVARYTIRQALVKDEFTVRWYAVMVTSTSISALKILPKYIISLVALGLIGFKDEYVTINLSIWF